MTPTTTTQATRALEHGATVDQVRLIAGHWPVDLEAEKVRPPP